MKTNQNRNVRAAVNLTPDLKTWVEQQRNPAESLSAALFRLLEEMRQEELKKQTGAGRDLPKKDAFHS